MSDEIIRFALLGLATGGIYGLIGLGIVFIYRGSGLLNFAQGAMAMFGAYVYYAMTVRIGLPTIVSAVIAILLSAGLGALIHRSMIVPTGDDNRKESLAVAFAEFFQADPGSITDGHFEAPYEEFTVEQVVELCTVVTMRNAGLQLGHIWGLPPAPDEVRDAYAAVIDEAQKRWESGDVDSGTASLWQRQTA